MFSTNKLHPHYSVRNQNGSLSVLGIEDFGSRGRRFRRWVFFVIALVSTFLGAILYTSTTVVWRHRGDKRAYNEMSTGDIFTGLMDTSSS